MSVTITRHFDYLTPFSAAENEEAWKWFPSSKPCQTPDAYAEYVFELPTWDDVKALVEVAKSIGGETVAKIDLQDKAAKAKEQAVRMITDPRERGKKGGRGKKANSNATSFAGRGAAYLLARIAKHHPDILDRYEAGEFKSVRAAAIEAGIVKIKSPLERIEALIPKLSDDERETLRQELNAAVKPKRITYKRGQLKPAGVDIVTRVSRWGNPYVIEGDTSREQAVELFRRDLLNGGVTNKFGTFTIADVQRELRGHDLGCSCDFSGPCHADVLLEVANAANLATIRNASAVSQPE